MSGVSESTITAADEAEIIASIASGSDATSADSITITSITDVARRMRALLSTGVDVVYETTIVLEETSYTSADDLFTGVTAEFETYVTSGDFETSLQASSSATLAAVDVAEDTFTAPTTYTSVDLTPTAKPTLSPTAADAEGDDDDSEKAGGLDTTVLIMIIVGVVAILGILYYIMGTKKKSSVAPS